MRTTLALVASLACVVLLGAAPSAAHPGPTDANGVHACDAAAAAANICTAAYSHRHLNGDPSNMEIVGPPNPVAVAAAVDEGLRAASPAAAVARTGPGSRGIALVGLLALFIGALLITSERAVPLPVVLELERS